MSLIRLTIENVRNLSSASLTIHPRLNIITGRNGSGKTSLLEAVYVLGRAKSFRDVNISNAIATGEKSARVTGVIETAWDSLARQTHVGIQWDRSGDRQVRMDGETVRRSSELSDALPLTYIGLQETRLLAEPPQQRRKFLDWALFHVEQRYREVWLRFERALKQRNAILKRRRQLVTPSEVEVWNKELVFGAEILNAARRNFLEPLEDRFRHHLQLLTEQDCGAYTLDYRPGWDEAMSNFQALTESRLRQDAERGFTQFGPHRADFVVCRGGRSMQQYGSAGEQKIAACALYLAQWDEFRRRTGRQGLILIDDMAAELDERRRKVFFRLLLSLSVQVFVTATEAELLESTLDDSNAAESARFHVEHGQVS